MSRERCEELMNIYLTAVLIERDYDRIRDIAAEDMVDHLQPTLRGPAALEAHARGFCENVTDLEIEINRVIATDDTVIGIWRWHGTPAVPSTTSARGTPVSPRLVASIFEVEDGMISDYRVFIDALDVFTQLMQ